MRSIDQEKLRETFYYWEGVFCGVGIENVRNSEEWKPLLAKFGAEIAALVYDGEPLPLHTEDAVFNWMLGRANLPVNDDAPCQFCGVRVLEFHKSNCPEIAGRGWDR